MDYSQSSNTVLARYMDAFIKRTSGIIYETAQDIGTGVERSLAKISPYVATNVDPRYVKLLSAQSKMISQEDERMVTAVTSLIYNPRLIYDMIKSIMDYILARTPEKTKMIYHKDIKSLGIKPQPLLQSKV